MTIMMLNNSKIFELYNVMLNIVIHLLVKSTLIPLKRIIVCCSLIFIKLNCINIFY